MNGNDQPLEFSFTVTYPDPMNPSGDPLVKVYKGAFSKTVNLYSGCCTTLNISLNHRDEQMFLGVEYNDWNFVSTPNLGELRKQADALIVQIWDLVEHYFRQELPYSKMQKCKQYGLIYYYRKGEKKLSAETDRELQRIRDSQQAIQWSPEE